MNRRQFFKTIAATVAGAVAVGVTPRVVQGESDRSVVWNHAETGRDDGYIRVIWQTPNRRYPYGMVQVEATGPIKKGQALVWNPDGTVRGL